MKLFDVPRYSYIRVLGEILTPVEGKETSAGNILKFLSLDGMYSRCRDEDGEIVHLVAWADVELVDAESVSWAKQ